MKKLLLIISLVFVGWSAQAQNEFIGSAEVGLPIGDASDITTFNLGIQLGYLFEVAEEVQVGPKIGYSHSFGDDVDTIIGTFEVDDIQFLPIAAHGRYNFSDTFLFGLDLGYAVGLNDGNDGGFYYSPHFAYNVAEQVAIFAAFRGISADGGSFDVISLGAEFSFN